MDQYDQPPTSVEYSKTFSPPKMAPSSHIRKFLIHPGVYVKSKQVSKTPTIVRTYEGHCKLDFDMGVEIETDFGLQLRSDGHVEISVTTPMTPNALKIAKGNEERGLLHCSLVGTVTKPQGKVNVPDMVLNVTTNKFDTRGATLTFELISTSTVEIEYTQVLSHQIVESHYGLTNFDFLGCEYTRDQDAIVADKFSAKVAGVKMIFKQVKDHARIISRLKVSHDVEVTAEVIAVTPLSDLNKLEQLVDDSMILLAYATGTYMSWVYRDVYSNGELIRSSLYAHNWGPFVPRNWVIDSRNLEACNLRIYLETAYPTFSTLKSDLGLRIVLEFLIVADQGRYPELLFLLRSVAAECLLSYLSSYFSKIGKEGDMGSFKSKMKELLRHFRVLYNESELDFISTRDKIVHTGRFPAGVTPWETTMKLRNLMDRTVLTILGYQGKPYVNCANDYKSEFLQEGLV